MSPQNFKVESIVNWPQPTNQKEFKQFIGLSSYYRRYINKIASITQPLNSLLVTDTTFMWSEDVDVAFKKLKEFLASYPVLILRRNLLCVQTQVEPVWEQC